MPTATPPPYSELVLLASGQVGLIERTWNTGDLFIGLVLVAVVALVAIDFAYMLSRAEGRRE